MVLKCPTQPASTVYVPKALTIITLPPGCSGKTKEWVLPAVFKGSNRETSAKLWITVTDPPPPPLVRTPLNHRILVNLDPDAAVFRPSNWRPTQPNNPGPGRDRSTTRGPEVRPTQSLPMGMDLRHPPPDPGFWPRGPSFPPGRDTIEGSWRDRCCPPPPGPPPSPLRLQAHPHTPSSPDDPDDADPDGAPAATAAQSQHARVLVESTHSA